MTEYYKIKAWSIKKSMTGGEMRKMRESGFIPAVIYGGESGSNCASISIPAVAIEDYINKCKGQNGVVVVEHLSDVTPRKIKLTDDEIKKERSERCFIRGIQYHPVTDRPLHVEMQRIPEGGDGRLRIRVKVKEKNYTSCVGIKRGGYMNKVLRSVTLSCTYDSIPGALEVDLENLDIGHTVHVNDLNLPPEIKPLNATNFAIISICGKNTEAPGKGKED